jgi:hypothetical protein
VSINENALIRVFYRLISVATSLSAFLEDHPGIYWSRPLTDPHRFAIVVPATPIETIKKADQRIADPLANEME